MYHWCKFGESVKYSARYRVNVLGCTHGWTDGRTDRRMNRTKPLCLHPHYTGRRNKDKDKKSSIKNGTVFVLPMTSLQANEYTWIKGKGKGDATLTMSNRATPDPSTTTLMICKVWRRFDHPVMSRFYTFCDIMTQASNVKEHHKSSPVTNTQTHRHRFNIFHFPVNLGKAVSCPSIALTGCYKVLQPVPHPLISVSLSQLICDKLTLALNNLNGY